MSSVFSGVCVGGPMAGRQMAYDKETMIVETANRQYIYRRVGFSGSPLGFWALDGMSAGDVLLELAKAYIAQNPEKPNA